jgi:hypothetical protein
VREQALQYISQACRVKKFLFGSGIKLYSGCRSSEMFFPFQGKMAGPTEVECAHPINLLYFYLIIIFYSKHRSLVLLCQVAVHDSR